MFTRLHTTLLLALCLSTAFAQNKVIDSLKQAVRVTATDSNYVKALVDLSWKLRNAGQDDSGLVYCKRAQRIAEKYGYKKFLGKALTISGIMYMDKGEYDSSRVYNEASLKVRKEINDKKGIAACYNNLGNLYESMGDYPRALEMQLAGLKIREEINERKDMAASYNNIGNIYMGMNHNEEALKNFFISLKIKRELGDSLGVGMSYCSVGLMYEARGDHTLALSYYQRSIAVEEEAGYLWGVADCYSNIGEVFQRKAKESNDPAQSKKFRDEAVQNYEHSLKVRLDLGDKQGIATSYSNLGAVLEEMGDHKRSEEYSLKALKLSKELHELYLLRDIHKNLSEVYKATGRYKEAFEHYKLGIAARDSLLNEANTKKTVQLQMQYEFDKKEAATKLEQEKKEALAAADKKRQFIILIAISGFGLLVLGFAIFAYRSLIQKKKANFRITKQKEFIEEKQKEILDSIYYARRIQRTLLTSERYIEKHLKKFQA